MAVMIRVEQAEMTEGMDLQLTTPTGHRIFLTYDNQRLGISNESSQQRGGQVHVIEARADGTWTVLGETPP